MALLSNQEIRDMMPRVGDVRKERPAYSAESVGHVTRGKPRRCVVVYVNLEHFWYTVQYANGIRESYKMPPTRLYGGATYG